MRVCVRVYVRVLACMSVSVHGRVSVRVHTCVPACGCACVSVGVCIADILDFFRLLGEDIDLFCCFVKYAQQL